MTTKMAKQDMKELGSVVLGAAVGAAVARYGSNAISNTLTKNNRDLAGGATDFISQTDLDNEVKKVAIWRKAYTWDVLLGLGAGAAGMYAKGLSSEMKLGLQSAGAYLFANGLLDAVGDLTLKAGDVHTYNGRPESKAAPKGFNNFGPMSRPMGRQMAMARPMMQAQSCGRSASEPCLF